MFQSRGWTRALIIVGLATTPATAQTLTPRAYWPAPVGTHLLAVGAAHQRGEVATDPSLPVQDLEAEVSTLQAAFVRFFDLGGRTASLTLEVPWTDASLDARFLGEEVGRDLSGWPDLKIRLAVNLRGAPAMTPEQFRRFLAAPEPLVGAGLRVQVPTGDYDPERLVNLGSNRWSIRPEIGYLRPLRGDWILELSLGTWLYGDNDDFQGRVREQDPLLGAELHLVRPLRRTRPRLWLSLDLNYFAGGRTRVDGFESDDLQRNSRVGATLALPLAPGHALKIAGTTSLVTERGGDYDSLVVAYQRAWR